MNGWYMAIEGRFMGKDEEYALLANADEFGISASAVAWAAATEIKRYIKGKRVFIACGTGGKGRIGMALACELAANAKVTVAIYGTKRIDESEKEEMKRMLYPYANIVEASNAAHAIKEADAVVDAIIGIGLKGSLSGSIENAIDAMNMHKRVYSIGIPSGIYADTGMKCRKYVKANEIFAIHRKNMAMEGLVHIINAGIPYAIEAYAGKGDIMLATKGRPIDANKYTNGALLVVGGSEKYSGAPQLAYSAAKSTLAALKAGSTYATLLVPSGIANAAYAKAMVVQQFQCNGLGEKIKGIRHNAIVIGPGIEEKCIESSISSIIENEREHGNSIVIDGSAIKLLKHRDCSGAIITPHEGEFRSIAELGESAIEKVHDATEFAKRKRCIVVLKGHTTIITDGKRTKINNAKTPALATMGTGDVLSGMIGAYASMSGKPFESAVAAVYVHSKIGDMLYNEKGLHIIADDVIDAIPRFLKSYDRISY